MFFSITLDVPIYIHTEVNVLINKQNEIQTSDRAYFDQSMKYSLVTEHHLQPPIMMDESLIAPLLTWN